MFGVHAQLRDNPETRELLERECVEMYQSEHDRLREKAKESIAKVQHENKCGDKNRITATKYREGDLMAIRRIQQEPGLKIANKYLGSYQVIRALRNDRYVVQREDEHEGPFRISTAAEHMKP